jgi:hypothetical protein
MIPVVVLGVTLGKSKDWDSIDETAIQFYGFEPDAETGLEKGDLYVNFETGTYEVYGGRDGCDAINSGNMLDLLKSVT